MQALIVTPSSNNNSAPVVRNAFQTMKPEYELRKVIEETIEAQKMYLRDIEEEKRRGRIRSVKIRDYQGALSRTQGIMEALKWALGDYRALGHQHPDQRYS